MHVFTHDTTFELTTLNDAMPSTSMVGEMADCMPSTSEIEFSLNEDDKSSNASTPPLGIFVDDKTAEKRPATLYARLNKKVQSVYGKATRTALNNALKPTQDAFYKMTGKPTAFKAAQFAPKYWKNQVFNNGIPANFTSKTFPMNSYDRNITDPNCVYNGSINNIIEQLEEVSLCSNKFVTTVNSLNNYIQKVAEAEVANSSNYVPTSALTKGLQIKKPGYFKTNPLHQMMTKLSSGNPHHADQRAFVCASVFNSYCPEPISAKPSTPVPPVETVEDEEEEERSLTEPLTPEKPSRKRKHESKDDKENVPAKIRRKDGLNHKKNHRKLLKLHIRKNGKLAKYRHKKFNEEKVSRNNGIRKSIDHKLYKNKRPVRVCDELHGERTTDRDLAYLKVRKLSIKTARRKPKPDFGIFCEATWFRRQLLLKMRDQPIMMDESEVMLHQPSLNGNKRKRRGSHMQDRAAQFVYAHIPTPEDLPPLPSAQPVHMDSSNNYGEIYEEYEQYVKNSHKQCSTKEDFHWEEYLTEKLAKIPNQFRNVEDLLGVKAVKEEIKEEIVEFELNDQKFYLMC